jgi:hypothetical protein
MAAIKIADTTSKDGDARHEAATAYACGWRIDADSWWVRPLKSGDPKDAPSDGRIRDGYVFAACAASALAFDRKHLPVALAADPLDVAAGLTFE